MRITKIEKMFMIIIVACILFIGIQYFYCMKVIKDQGGIKELIIGTGKEIKNIKKEIEKEE